VPLGFRM